jgi:hypothetical protein
MERFQKPPRGRNMPAAAIIVANNFLIVMWVG